MSDERARTINTLREITQALAHDDSAAAVEVLGSVGPEAENGRPSAAQLSYVALQSLDSWYAKYGLNGRVRVAQREVPRSIRNITPAIEALAGKGRALSSIASLLQRNPQQTVAGAGSFMVAAALSVLAQERDTDVVTVLDELLPAQEVSEPVTPVVVEDTPAAPTVAAPVAETPQDAQEVVDVVDETVDAPVDADDPAARYAAILETRFMAGVKEFAAWMGDGHAVTGTGLPKRADIQDVAATIGIDAEGVAKKPEEAQPADSDLDLTVPAAAQPTRFATSAQAIPELMAFWTALQATGQVELTSTKIQPGANASGFAFEDTDQLAAAEELVTTYVAQTLSLDADEEAAAQTARFLQDGASAEGVLIPRLRQLEAMELVELTDGKPVIPAALRAAVLAGAQQVAN